MPLFMTDVAAGQQAALQMQTAPQMYSNQLQESNTELQKSMMKLSEMIKESSRTEETRREISAFLSDPNNKDKDPAYVASQLAKIYGKQGDLAGMERAEKLAETALYHKERTAEIQARNVKTYLEKGRALFEQLSPDNYQMALIGSDVVDPKAAQLFDKDVQRMGFDAAQQKWVNSYTSSADKLKAMDEMRKERKDKSDEERRNKELNIRMYHESRMAASQLAGETKKADASAMKLYSEATKSLRELNDEEKNINKEIADMGKRPTGTFGGDTEASKAWDDRKVELDRRKAEIKLERESAREQQRFARGNASKEAQQSFPKETKEVKGTQDNPIDVTSESDAQAQADKAKTTIYVRINGRLAKVSPGK